MQVSLCPSRKKKSRPITSDNFFGAVLMPLDADTQKRCFCKKAFSKTEPNHLMRTAQNGSVPFLSI